MARDVLADASNLTEVAEECGWNGQLPEEQAELAGRVEAWAVQLQLIARSIREALGVETGESAAGPGGPSAGPR